MIEKTVEIDGRELRIRCSALTPRHYRAEFGRDMILDIREIFQIGQSGYTPDIRHIIEDLLYCFAKEADGTIGGVDDFLSSFDSPMLAELATAPIMQLWAETMHMTSESDGKKKEPPEGTPGQPLCSDAPS